MYVHLPWCQRKCPYCDFNSHPLKGDLPASDYVDALLADLESVGGMHPDRRYSSVFFGGGTPSLFDSHQIERILNHLDKGRWLQTNPEITIEANPGSAEVRRFQAYRDCGVNRLSLGVQSFKDQSLNALGRIHDGHDARQACRAIRDAGFDNFNIDLMHGLPGQNQADALSDLHEALTWAPTHLSLYQLTIEPNTAFAADPPLLPDEEVLSAIRCAVHDLAGRSGFEHYEVSAFARPEYRCRHNLNYWEFGDYIGIGAGAHSKLSFGGAVYRWRRPRHPHEYLRIMATGCTPDPGPPLQPGELLFEFMLNALRLKMGFDYRLFEQRTGLDWSRQQPLVEKAVADGLMRADRGQVSTTPLGWRFLDDLLQRFLSREEEPLTRDMMA
ncbi:MAG: radical SAM family heme chaperone HemW [Arenicellales bacterium]|nr:radical SAM family heme chaperone HemW [Arenicellales bacterium]MDP6790627.1 radical SAM family heme chaperone HemW [Arenicellales bacterium]MDP6919195.1 radical SAM family heme chaperone HemW [Arenicellales bacterium]